ncbi:butyrophilin subfamily 2 member A2-like isoform X2 [Labrus mixtus]|uniref:butyrophilin subfamily 2 member A2-like isoform X2 n=1 Tax=Labrus mixtus TaxID=508554 RepID=UPI0029C0660F|nr:butyrophilin subfamily 2 member A2-like isoform X2 [Labrus mixtus]
MRPLKDGWPSKRQHSSISAVLFHQTVVLLFLTPSCAAQSLVFTPSQLIVARVGEDIVLPCYLDPPVDATDLTVEWRRPDLNPRFVYLWHNGVELGFKKHPSYEGRTSMSINKLKHGDISLKVHKVKLSDEGRYGCFIPAMNREATVELLVGAVSSLIICFGMTETDGDIRRLVLQCESEGWYPEPEVLWLDSEGNLLSAGSTETIRGPDDLYTVSSRVTVERRHNNMFTCRVTQNNINQTRETLIHVPDDFSNVQCSATLPIICSLVVGFVVILSVVFLLWIWRQKQKRNIRMQSKTDTTSALGNTELDLLNAQKTETQQDFAESPTIQDLDEKKASFDVELKEMEDERRDLLVLINLLMNYKKDLDDQRKHYKEHQQEVQRQNSQNHLLEKGLIKQNGESYVKYSEDNETDMIMKSILNMVEQLIKKKQRLTSRMD